MSTVVTPVKQPKLKKRKWPFYLTGSILLLVILALSVSFWFVQKTAPETNGEITLSGLEDSVSIYRDRSGVPHIEASSTKDLFMAQGFVTAQDRMFQMDLSRRQASGTLSEVIGKSTIDNDKFFRTLGLRRAAEDSYNAYSDEAKQILEWYADGVNAYMTQAKAENSLPIEFTLAGYEPNAWTPLDSLTIGKYMAFDLGGHWEGQAFRYYLLQNFSEEEAMDLFPSYPDEGSTVIQEMKESQLDISKSFAKAVIPDPFNGSNNWVVSGEKTASGKPLLANDPHLGLGTPPIWYETHLNSPDYHVSGVIFAGVPGIIVGRNDSIAWGVTNVGPDVQDLYIEKRNPDNPTEFQYNDKWETAEVLDESIPVKNSEPIPYEVVITRHGPILSEFAHDDQPDTALSLRWTALDPSTELEAVLKIDRASNWEEFKEALTSFHTPAQNFVFASTDGTIAYRANGLIPIRKNGDSMLPVPGWNDDYEWDGYIPWEELPTIVNPDEGFISTANNKITTDDYPYHITHTWAQPYRQNRIREVLIDGNNLETQDMMNLQNDFVNLQGKELTPLLTKELHRENLTSVEKDALSLLQEWNYIDGRDEAAPLLFHLWIVEMEKVLFDGKIDKEMMPLFDGKSQVIDQLIRRAVDGEEGPWMEKSGGFQSVVTKSYQAAVDRAASLQGHAPKKWAWGTFHSVPFEHPLGAIKPLHLLFNPEVNAMGGSRVTVGAAGWNSSTGTVNHGAPWRGVTDLANMETSYNVISPGQSGYVFSEWYDNQIDDWVNGRYHETKMSGYEENAKHLILKP
ncbi:penicillin acylase family protein [Pseudalkalibacillus hwajinpoensis]|uniref:penicillin acylase family protein n=1 Tax=Guptibacillus hwajinpoensis TaxID=208199 RepID=UPI001CD78367|nr:penicillin acylase family protein [Pseudalkalibacillus hwajinpoensis]MCA0990676.1 penicillin acylase family protein [Pseudalkalibacillus hwajinpoensis]